MPAQQPDPFADLARFTFGQNRQPLAQMEEIIRKSAPAEYPPIEAKLVALLKAPDTTKDAKRYICRYLGIVGSAACVPAVAELLTDADLSHPARLALEPLAAPEAGAALRAALPKVQGKLLAGVIGSIGIRRDAQAVGALATLARQPDEMIAATALAALGEIGTEEAARALESAQVPPALRRALARAKIAAAGHLSAAGKNATAAAIYRPLMGENQPAAIRVAALKGLIGALPAADAVKLIAGMVQGDDEALRAATLSAFISSPDKALKDGVASALATMKPAGQLILLGVLADQPEVAARAGLLKVLDQSSEEKIKVATLNCLAIHGEAADVPKLASLAGGPSGPLAEAAKKALQRLGKPGVDEALVKLIESSNAADRAIALATLANRRVESALPALVRLLNGTDATVAVEAAKGLGIMGKSDQLKDLAKVIASTSQAPLRAAAADAAKAICRRTADKPAAAQPLLAALAEAKDSPGRIALLETLPFTGGEAALGAVTKAIKDASPEIRSAATSALIAWPEAAAGAPLLELAKNAPDAQAIVALRDGCLRLAEMDELSAADRVAILKGVFEVAKRAEEKKRALAVLADVPSAAALDLLVSQAKDAALQTDAIKAGIKLARQIAGVHSRQAVDALQNLKGLAATDDLKKQIDDALKAVQNAGQSPDGFILAWLMAGPFTKEGKDGNALFDEVLPPEQPGGKVEWRPVTAPKSGLVELDKILRGGDNRVAYLKTQIVSDTEQEALLEMGSDDGIKVWLNGKVVHANNAVRPCAPGQDKKKVKLAKGANALLVKITQGGGQWAGCVRLRAADGREIKDVTVGPAAE